MAVSVSYQEAQSKGRKLLDKHGLHEWRISLENLRNTDMYGQDGIQGCCDFENRTIRIDNRIGRQFRQAMLHEIAHALTPADKSHGEEWLKKAGEIGCSFVHLLSYIPVRPPLSAPRARNLREVRLL